MQVDVLFPSYFSWLSMNYKIQHMFSAVVACMEDIL